VSLTQPGTFIAVAPFSCSAGVGTFETLARRPPRQIRRPANAAMR
jgi:hypothetical protein